MKVAVLGSGYVGVMAAHAAALNGYTPDIFGIAPPRRGYGAQYLRDPIPGIHGKPEGMVKYTLMGTKEKFVAMSGGGDEYAALWDTAPPEPVPAWNIVTTHHELHKKYSDRMSDTEVRATMVRRLLEEYDYVFNSLNIEGLCFHPDHKFEYCSIALRGQCDPITKDNEIIYNGSKRFPWHGSSKLFGFGWVETAKNVDLTLKGVIRKIVNRPLKTNCDCYNQYQNFIPVGAYGKFNFSSLCHEAFLETSEILAPTSMPEL